MSGALRLPARIQAMPERDKPSRPPLVLVANDQEWSARSLESILGPHGYAVLRAYTGRQTIDLARSAQPDVIILDARLPDLDGLDVCRSLRADPRMAAHISSDTIRYPIASLPPDSTRAEAPTTT